MVEAWNGSKKFTFRSRHDIDKNFIFHRDDGPTYIEYDKFKHKILEIWYKDGKIHRLDGPAWIKYNKSNRIEAWFQNNKIHRENGPAYIKYEKGKVVKVAYYLKGNLYSSKETFEKDIIKYKVDLI